MTRLTFLIALLVLSACNTSPGTSGTPSASIVPPSAPSASPTTARTIGPTNPPSAAASPTPAAEPTVAVAKIEQQGGMLPPWETLRFYPSVALYSDGRLITQGPQIEIYPGPALPNLQVTQLTQAGVQQVLDWAAEAGLQGADRQLGEPIMDAGQTVFTVATDEGTHHTSVTDLGASDAEIGALRQFHDLMTNLRAYLDDEVVGEDQPYAYDRLRVISGAADESTVVDPELANTLEWPLDAPIADLGTPISDPANWQCGLVEGDDLVNLRPLLDQANELTIWESDGNQYVLRLHPLLPDEEPCPGI